jgi:DNA repair protein RadC
MCRKNVQELDGAEGGAVRASDLPRALQPREKFDRIGPENLAESDLLALLLRTGARGLNVVSLAERLLLEYGTLSALAQASAAELCQLRGIGREKAKILKAALELGRRLVQERVGERPRIIAPEDAAAVLRERARTLDREVFWVLLLDTRSRLLAPPCEISRGTLSSSLVHPREVFKPAIRNSAAAVILAHNHPSGDPSPSAQDVQITCKLTEAGRLLDIRVLDHLILGRRTHADAADFISLREAGLAEFDRPARSNSSKNLSDCGSSGV